MYDGYVLGHETMGIVEEAGKEVTRVKKGDRVIVPFPVSCGHCAFCEAGEYSQCDNSNPNGEAGGLLGYSESFGVMQAGRRSTCASLRECGPGQGAEELDDEQVLFLPDILPTSRWGARDRRGEKGRHGGGPRLRAGRAADMQMGPLSWSRPGAGGGQRGLPRRTPPATGAETLNFEDYDNTGLELKELTHGGADVVIDCVGMDGKMSAMEKMESVLKLQAGSKSAVEIACEAVRKCGTVAMVGRLRRAV